MGPAIDDDVKGTELEKSVVRELSTLRAEAAELAAKHLVMTGRLLDEDPEAAYEHAMAARKCGPRVAVIREAVGIAAYTSGRWAEALAELRTARRISGDDEHWPMMADCERALGRPEKALAMASAPEVQKLSKPSLIEMRIVAAGARADLGQLDAAVVTLQTADLTIPNAAWAPRLRFAYAAALEAAGRRDEARDWYAKAAAVDPEGETDAAARLQELDGIHFLDEDDDLEESEQEDEPGSVSPAARAASESVPATALTGSAGGAAAAGSASATVPIADGPAAIPAGDRSNGAPSSAPAAEQSARPAAAAANLAGSSAASSASAVGGSPVDPTASAAGDHAESPTEQSASAAAGSPLDPTASAVVGSPVDPTASAAGDHDESPADQSPSAAAGSPFDPTASAAAGLRLDPTASAVAGSPVDPTASAAGDHAESLADQSASAAGDFAGSPADSTARASDAHAESSAHPTMSGSGGLVDQSVAAAGDLAGGSARHTAPAEPTPSNGANPAATPAASAGPTQDAASPFSERVVVESPHADSAPSMPAGGLFLDAALPARDTDDEEDEGDGA